MKAKVFIQYLQEEVLSDQAELKTMLMQLEQIVFEDFQEDLSKGETDRI
jgi:hypothetical protein